MAMQPRVIGFVSHVPGTALKQAGKAEYSVFSNWAPAEFVEDGKTYIATEQYMMEKKALHFGDQESANKIMAFQSTEMKDSDWRKVMGEIKQLGRGVKNFDGQKWDEASFAYVRHGIFLKFSQNAKMKETLISTGDAVLCEASATDNIWGIGIPPLVDGKPNPDVQDKAKWKGTNRLGFYRLGSCREVWHIIGEKPPSAPAVEALRVNNKQIRKFLYCT